MTQTLAPASSTLWKVIDRLEKANIPYTLTGSIALNVYGHTRATNDFHIVIQIGKSDVGKIISLFERDCYISKEAVEEAIQHQSMFNIIDNETVFKVDFIVAKNDAFSSQQFDRRQKISFQDKPVYVISAEDLILSKLAWSQESLSELQESDIQNMLRILGDDLDKIYLEKWALKNDWLERLEKLYAEN